MSTVSAAAPIAIVGVGALFPGSTDAGGFWRDILAGRDLMTDVPPTHWLIEDYYDPDPSAPDKTYCKRGAFLGPTPFDPVAFGIPPSTLSATDTAQLLALIVAKQVLDDASRGQFANLPKERISVILGATSGQELFLQVSSRLQRPVWVKALREHGLPEAEVQAVCDAIANHYVPWQESTFPGLLGNVVAGRIANRFDLGGTNCVTDAACASSFSAVLMAVDELRQGRSDMVITGGVDTFNDIGMYMCFSKTPALSPTGDCRPFSDQADGTMMGEGLAMVALKRLEDAERDGDPIYAVIRGIGAASDGRAMSVYAPLPAGQARALRRAYDAAGYEPGTVELVEAHGTGTKAGDVAEFEGLKLAFGEDGRTGWCALGSVKSQIGHTKAAAGAAGLFKAIMALHHQVLPPTIKVEAPNPKLGVQESPFYLNTAARPWIRGAAHPRRAGVSAFGFGGSNFHLALEEYVGPGQRAKRWLPGAAQLVLLGAEGAGPLAARCRELAAVNLPAGAPALLPCLAHETQLAFDPAAAVRLAVVATDDADLARKLQEAAKKLEAEPGRGFSAPGIHVGYGAADGQLAFLFPGQGSQYVGMGGDLAIAFPAARASWDRAADQAEGLPTMVFPPPAFTPEERAEQKQRLTDTRWAQPAIGAVSLSMLALLEGLGLKPAAVAGHSFGELSALACAGALAADGLLHVARRRGERMAEAAAVPGAMTAVVAPREELEGHLAAWAIPGLVIANHNAPRQVVLAGPVEAVAEAERRLGQAGLAFKRLPVATAFHSEVVAGASVPFGADLAEVTFKAPAIPVYGNTEAAPYPAAPEAIRGLLAGQIAKPVRFVELVEAMYAAGCRTFLEVGPGAVLTGLVGEILAGRPHRAIPLDRANQAGLTAWWDGLGQLAAAGHALAFGSLWDGMTVPPDPRTQPTPAFAVPLIGANYGRPYPPQGGAAALPAPNPPKPVAVPAAPALVAAAPVPAPSPAISAAETPAPTPVAATAPGSDALAAYQALQRSLTESHLAFQSALAESQQTYMTTLEQTFLGLWGGAAGQPPMPAQVAASAVVPAAAPMPPAAVPLQVAAPVQAAPPAAAAPVPAPVAAPAPAVDLQALMLSIVAEKTGYPQQMLNLDMALEADLGIDSIKRVEILAAMQAAAPGLPEVDATRMASLRTLAEIVDYMQAQTPTAPAPAASIDLAGLMLEIVAEKTGYPVAMLTLDMALEADLGIDSIKRVEILAAMQTRAPGLPEVDATKMASLRTLAEIVDFMGANAPASAPAAPTENLEALMLAIVAEKTGYPQEMLTLEMALEADLGIDSIKRVEILAAVQARVPGLPEVDAGIMASMRTLGQITEAMRATPTSMTRTVPDAAPSAPAGVGRAAVRAFPVQASGHRMDLLAGPVAIIPDDQGVAEALAALLAEAGCEVQIYADVPPDATSVLFLAGLNGSASPDVAAAVQRAAFRAARALAPRASVFVTVQDTGGSFGLVGPAGDRAWYGGLPGLVKTAGKEWPQVEVKAIDIERAGRSASAIAAALAAELLSGGPEREVGLTPDARYAVRAVEAPTTAGELPVDANSVVLVSGGARGVTAASVIGLAKASRARFVLLGRTALEDEPPACQGQTDEAGIKRALMDAAVARGERPTPTELGSRAAKVLAAREVRDTVAAIQAAGGDARYIAADVQDEAVLSAALADVRAAWGPFTGLVHGAGVLADRLIAEKADAQFDAVFDTKIRGLHALFAVTAKDPLRFVALFSSVAAREGNLGQCDYAMANAILDQVALAEAARRGPGCRFKSIAWGPWAGGMVTPSLAEHFTRQGVALLEVPAGVAAFQAELADPGDVSVVVGGSLPGGGPTRARHVVTVGATTHAYLADHQVQGKVVLPAVMALEWFMRAARSLVPGREVQVVRDLQVLKGIVLDAFPQAPATFIVDAELVGDEVQLALTSRDGIRHYTARALLGTQVTPPPTPALTLPADADAARLYGEHLFHGPAFQVLKTLAGPVDGTLAADALGVAAAGWGQAPWQSDPAALDGAIQLALAWGVEVLGRPSLPTRVGAYIPFVHGPAAGRVRIEARCVPEGKHQVRAHLLLRDEDGVPFAALEDLELTLLAERDPVAAR